MFFRKTAKTQSKIMMSYMNIYIHLNIRTVYMEAVTNITLGRKSKMEAVVFFSFSFFFDS